MPYNYKAQPINKTMTAYQPTLFFKLTCNDRLAIDQVYDIGHSLVSSTSSIEASHMTQHHEDIIMTLTLVQVTDRLTEWWVEYNHTGFTQIQACSQGGERSERPPPP